MEEVEYDHDQEVFMLLMAESFLGETLATTFG